ncbi:hypothetical protein [Kitasatospora sp. NPDC048407]|uniref:hypothetical protein n=1 Tax=Kitasatospora sp. NPDC048407 TaxID=3364051 RepID=UPI00371F6E1F
MAGDSRNPSEASATATSSRSGGGAAPNQQTPPHPAPGATTAKPPASTVPAGCGGANWGAIVNVADGQKLGLATDSPSAGAAAVMGGTTAYGWVRSAPDPGGWYQFHPCNLSGPVLVQGESDGGWPAQNRKVQLSSGFSFMTTWSVVTASTSGAYYLQAGDTCLTNNGPGKQVTMTACTPANKFQEWRIP